jgi:biofilm PGA synthesis N-glycosyltransferase PgaC
MSPLLLIILILLFLYPFAICPVVFRLIAGRRREVPESEGEPDGLPSAVLVICALNEERIIRRKMENSLALRYPEGKLKIVVVSDGSTDRTVDVVREFQKQGIQLIEQPKRRGKIANLNAVLPTRKEAILVLSDANVMYDPDALLCLVARFRDPSVGCVSGKVILTDSAPELDQPTSDYYSIEWLLQEKSSDIYSMVGADGAMYALRRELFRPCPNDTIIEDFVIPMNVVRQGKRTVFEPEAVGWEQGPSSLREEFRRKVRIAAGCVQALVRGNAWPINAPARFWFIYISHKLLRWMSPLVGLLILVLASLSLDQRLSRIVAEGFLLMGSLAILRLLTGWKHPLVSAPFYFLFGQVALAWGMIKGLTGLQPVLWVKADR